MLVFPTRLPQYEQQNLCLYRYKKMTWYFQRCTELEKITVYSSNLTNIPNGQAVNLKGLLSQNVCSHWSTHTSKFTDHNTRIIHCTNHSSILETRKQGLLSVTSSWLSMQGPWNMGKPRCHNTGLFIWFTWQCCQYLSLYSSEWYDDQWITNCKV